MFVQAFVLITGISAFGDLITTYILLRRNENMAKEKVIKLSDLEAWFKEEIDDLSETKSCIDPWEYDYEQIEDTIMSLESHYQQIIKLAK